MTTEEFEKKSNSGKLILVDFFATWCGPCQMMTPIIEKIKEKYEKDEKVEVLTIDIDENPEIPAKFSVMSVPSFVYIKDGKAVDTVIGATTEENLVDRIEKLKK
jgi:thioredoxin 1